MCQSPSKTGVMREDKFWLLVNDATPRASFPVEDGRSVEVQPVNVSATTLEGWKTAPRLAEMARNCGSDVMYYGRRINDEVDLFLDEDGKEPAHLRQSMEEKGLTVRTYTPESEQAGKSKFKRPDFNATLGSGEKTLMQKCGEATREAITDHEREQYELITYGIIVDAKVPKKKTLLIVKLREIDFCNFWREGSEQTWTSDGMDGEEGVDYLILGGVEDGKLRFKYQDEKLTSFFTKDGDLMEYTRFFDQAEKNDIDDARAAKAEKKRAKKHRRQVTASTLTGSSDSWSTPPQESEEAVKARQRAKEKAKKKEQKKRKQAAENIKDDDDDNFDKNRMWMIQGKFGLGGTHLILRAADGTRKMIPKGDLWKYKAVGNADAAQEYDTIDHLSLGSDSSSSDTDGTDDAEGETGLKVLPVTVNSIDEFYKVIETSKGTVLVARPDALGLGIHGAEEEQGKGLKYLGNGL